MLKTIFYTFLYTVLILNFSEISCFATEVISREPIIEINKAEKKMDINGSLLLYKDKSRKLGIDDVQRKYFSPNHKSNINLGYNNDADWIKFNIRNTSNSHEELILRIDKLLVDSVVFYFYNYQEQKWDSLIGGANINNQEKPVLGYGTYFPIQVPPDKVHTFYLRCISSYGKNYSLSIINAPAQHHIDMVSMLYVGGFLGILLCITLYNLFIGFTINDKLYLHYAFANLFTLLAGLGVMGVYVYYVSGNNINLIPYLTSISIGLYVLFSTNFNIRILELRRYSKFALYLMLFVALFVFCVTIGLNILRFFDKPMHYSFISLSSLLFSLTALISGVIALKKGSKYARFYIMAWGAALIGLLLKSLMLQGYIDKTPFTNSFYAIGAALEVLLLSFALADRYNFMQKEKNKLELELQYKKNDLSKVVSDNRMRHSFKVKLLEGLKGIYQNKSGSVIQDLGSFVTDLSIQIEAEEKRNQLHVNIDTINTEFERKLKERFPKLTKSEIEICGYLKLNLSTKEIASLRNTSENSVKVNKHRLNKKLLEEGSSLDALIYEL